MWLRIPISAYSLASEVSTSELDSLSHRLSADVMSRSTLKPPKFWKQGLAKGRWKMLRSGATLPLSLQNSIVAGWLESLPGGHARLSQSPGSEREQKTSDGSGPQSSILFATLTPSGSWERTSPAYYLPMMEWHSGMYSETWPDSGCVQNGSAYELPTLALRTGESAYLFSHSGPEWRSPTSSEADHGGPNARGSKGGGRSVDQATVEAKGQTESGKRTVGLESQSRFWPTPNTPSGGPNTKSTVTHTGGLDLDGSVLNWGTPTSRDYKDGGSADTVPTNGLLGRRQVIQNWQTPTANTATYTGGNSPGYECLPGQVQNWPTPDARDHHPESENAAIRRAAGAGGLGLTHAARCLSSPPDQAQPNSGSESSPTTRGLLPPYQRKRLNPLFVNWMHGWPTWWTCTEQIPYARQEMALHLSALRSHFEFLLKGRG